MEQTTKTSYKLEIISLLISYFIILRICFAYLTFTGVDFFSDMGIWDFLIPVLAGFFTPTYLYIRFKITKDNNVKKMLFASIPLIFPAIFLIGFLIIIFTIGIAM